MDHLFILTETLDQAHELRRISEDEKWKADIVRILEDPKERFRALGTSHPDYVISFWWD